MARIFTSGPNKYQIELPANFEPNVGLIVSLDSQQYLNDYYTSLEKIIKPPDSNEELFRKIYPHINEFVFKQRAAKKSKQTRSYFTKDEREEHIRITEPANQPMALTLGNKRLKNHKSQEVFSDFNY